MNFFYHQLTELYLTLCSFRFSREFHHVFTSGLEFNVIDIVGNIQILENVFSETLQSVWKILVIVTKWCWRNLVGFGMCFSLSFKKKICTLVNLISFSRIFQRQRDRLRNGLHRQPAEMACRDGLRQPAETACRDSLQRQPAEKPCRDGLQRQVAETNCRGSVWHPT